MVLMSCAGTSNPEGSTSGTGLTIEPVMLGIHAYSEKPQTGSGGLRLVCYPNWSQIEPARGQFDWAAADAAVDAARAWGINDILFAFCGTPQWAGSPVADPKNEVLGPGSTSAPKDMNDWRNFIKAFAQHFASRINAYEVWNEATTPQFWQGTPDQMAQMTAIAYEEIHRVDPKAIVTSASMQTHKPTFLAGFIPAYLAGLKARDWPVDVWSGHFYAKDPATRRQQLTTFRDALAKANAPTHPMWDSEVNFDVSGKGGEPDGRITGDRAVAWTVRSYLDTWRSGYQREYWYLWRETYVPFVGIQTRPGDVATHALATFNGWVRGAQFTGCTGQSLVTCNFERDGSTVHITWSESGQPAVLSGGGQVCELPSGDCHAMGANETVGDKPVLIRS